VRLFIFIRRLVAWKRQSFYFLHQLTLRRLLSSHLSRRAASRSRSRYTQHGRTVGGFGDDDNIRGDVVVCERHLSVGSDDGRVQRRRDVGESERDFDRAGWDYVSD